MNKTTGVISGRPTTAGTYDKIKVTLSNIAGSVTSPLGAYSITILALNNNVVGTYVGLVDHTGSVSVPLAVPSTALAPLHALGARLDLTIQTNGSFSGKITVGTKPYGFVGGILDNSVTPAHGTVLAISRGTGKTTLKLEFDLDAGTNLLSGTVIENTGGAVAASISGWRNTWKTTGTILSPANPATTRAGKYHNFKAVDPGMVADAALPEGASYGAVNILLTGSAVISGRTAMGDVLATTAPMGPTGQVLVYQSLYAGSGSFAGSLLVADDAAHKLTGSVKWSRDAQKAGRLYKAGWPAAPISLTATGGLYSPVSATTSSTTIMGLALLPAPPTIVTNAKLDFEGGGVGSNPPAPGTTNAPLDPEIIFQVFSLAKPVMPGVNPATVKMSVLNNTTGAFSGSFTLIDGALPKRTITYQGLIIPDGTTVDAFDGTGAGYYIVSDFLPTLTTSKQRSGLVTFKADP